MSDGFPTLPPLNALRIFEVVARHLNFRLAAEELGVTQAAVAQQVRGLEAKLAIRLFERRPRGLALTDAGRAYESSVRSALSIIDEATRLLKPEPLHITVSVTPSFASKWLIPRLGNFAEHHPDIDLRVLATERLSHFQTDGVDLAVRYGVPDFGPGLHVERLFEQRIVAVASPLLFLEKAMPNRFEDLQRFALLHDAHDHWPAFTARLFPEHASLMTKHMRFNQTSLAIEAAIGGQGIALATAAFVAQDIAAGRLVQVFEQRLDLEQAFFLVWPHKSRNAPTLQRVAQWLKDQAGSS